MNYRRYPVRATDREPLLRFILRALEACGCKILNHTPPTEAPFRISLEAPDGERFGILAYAFLANSVTTKNRPKDEHRFQLKYGPKELDQSGQPVVHELCQDDFGLYTTLLVGINTDRSFFVGYDPVLHRYTKFYISLEFKEEHAQAIESGHWHAWERTKISKQGGGLDERTEVVVGGTPEAFLQYVQFERLSAALPRNDQGDRGLLADKVPTLTLASRAIEPEATSEADELLHHPLLRELQLAPDQLLDLIAGARRLKMAVRGWTAEVKLYDTLKGMPELANCERLDVEGGADLRVRLDTGRPLLIECKNVLRQRRANGMPCVDFMRTRSSKEDPCSRFYKPDDFDVVAACLHAVTEQWEFRFHRNAALPAHPRCDGRLDNRLVVGDAWSADPIPVLRTAAGLPA